MHSITGDERHMATPPCRVTGAQHAERKIAANGVGARAHQLGRRDAGPCREVEDMVTRLKLQTLTCSFAPSPVHPTRKHGIRDVVAARNSVEHGGHLAWLLV